MAAVVAALEQLGAVTTDPADSLVRLTPLGTWAVREALQQEGFTAPLIEEMVTEPADVVCDALLDATPDTTDNMLIPWVAARGDEAAAAELAACATETTSPSVRLVAIGALAYTRDVGLAQAQRLRSSGGLAGAVATAWLIQHGALDETEADQRELRLALADNLATMAEHDDLIDELTTHPVDEQLDLVHMLADTDHPDRIDLLEVIIAEHPDQAVTSAARDALRNKKKRGNRHR
jgi:hypothetical protein